MSSFPRPALLPALAVLLAAGCAPVRSHQGYVLDVDLVNSVQPGVDTRESVIQTLGRPTVTSQFADREDGGGGDFYYVARDSANLAFRNPRPSSQLTIQISFDAAGTVTAVRRSGTSEIASVNPSDKVTPTLGRKRGFFQDLFGNIGTVGAGGAGGAAGGQGGGAGR